MPNRSLEEENIDLLLSHFQQQGQQPAIQEWRQRIEDIEARSARRSSLTIGVEQALKDLRNALLEETGLSRSAEALVRKLNRPTNSKFTAIEAWRLQNPAYRPTSLTPEQQIYVDRYDRNEHERRKWYVEISPERWERWGTLEEVIWDCTKRAEKAKAQGAIEDVNHFTKHAEKARNELRADLAKVGEQWMTANPELARQLVDQFIGKLWVKPVPTQAFKEYRANELAALKGAKVTPSDLFSDPWAASPVFPQEAFYRGRLYFIAANLVLKYFGLNDAVAVSLIEYIRGKKQDESEQDPEANQNEFSDRAVAAGRVYLNLYEELHDIGIGCTTILKKGLSKALKELLNDPDQIKDHSSTSFSEIVEVSNNKGEKDNGNNLDRVLWWRSSDFRTQASPETRQVAEEQQQAEYEQEDKRREALQALKTSLNSRQVSILILRETGHTHDAIAQKLHLSPRTIKREFNRIKSVAQSLRDHLKI